MNILVINLQLAPHVLFDMQGKTIEIWTKTDWLIRKRNKTWKKMGREREREKGGVCVCEREREYDKKKTEKGRNWTENKENIKLRN